MKGTVVWFNGAKGFGFLRGQDGKETFCHFSAIQMDGYRTLEQGQRVEFEIIPGEQGPQADNVRVIGE
jgi:CspA family cold shock protein